MRDYWPYGLWWSESGIACSRLLRRLNLAALRGMLVPGQPVVENGRAAAPRRALGPANYQATSPPASGYG